MSGFVSRGFSGRRRVPEELAERLPPGQYVEPGFPVLTAGPTPDGSTPTTGASGSTAWSASEREWTWEEFRRAAVRDGPLRHPLRHEVVEARHQLRRRLGRHAARGRRAARRLRDGLLVRRLHDQPAARGPHRRQGLGRDRARGRAAAARARRARPGCWSRTSTSGRAPSGSPGCGSWTTTSRASGSRTATTTAATPGRRSAIGATDAGRAARARPLADRHGRVDQAGDAAREVVPDRAADVDAAPAGAALRRPADRARRLPGPALLLGRLVTARRGADRADDRPARRRRGLPVLPRGRRRGRPGRGPRPVRVLLRVARRAARCCSSAAARAWCR